MIDTPFGNKETAFAQSVKGLHPDIRGIESEQSRCLIEYDAYFRQLLAAVTCR